MTFYGITISPKYRTIDPDILYNEDMRIIRRWMNRFSSHYVIVPEFAELTARLHYHGTVIIADMIKFYKTKYRIDKEIGFVKIDLLKTFKDHLRWNIYIYKNYWKTRDHYDLVIYGKVKRINKREHLLHLDLKRQNRLNIIDYFQYIVSKEL